MRFLSYNVHSWTGTDRVKDYRRALDIICGYEPDAAALQEVVIPASADDLEEAHSFIEEYTGMNAVFGQTMLQSDSPYGNVLLTKKHPARYSLYDISVKGYEPRGLIYAEADFEKGRIALLATHLGLKKNERIKQAQMVYEIIKDIKIPFVLMSDSNDWYRGQASKILDRCTCRAERLRTFPSAFPLFALDSIRSKKMNLDIKTLKGNNVRKVSDHLPVLAEGFPE